MLNRYRSASRAGPDKSRIILRKSQISTWTDHTAPTVKNWTIREIAFSFSSFWAVFADVAGPKLLNPQHQK
jgi:hypothetical protein